MRKGRESIEALLRNAASGETTVTKLISHHCKKSLHRLRQLHALFTVSGQISDHLLAALLAAATTPSPHYALSLFTVVENPSTFCFNHVIRAHTLLSSPLAALRFFRALLRSGDPISPDFHSFPLALAACAQLGSDGLSHAKAVHSQALKLGFDSDTFVVNSLIRAYSVARSLSDAVAVFGEARGNKDVVTYNTLINSLVKAGEVILARKLFDEMPVRDSISWGTMVAGYARAGFSGEAVRLFFEMIDAGVRPDNIALVSALSACAQLGDLDQGRTIHRYIRENRNGLDSYLLTGLVDFYGKCGFIETAKEIFDSHAESANVCSWNAVIVGFAMHGMGESSLDYFQKMVAGGFVKPDGVTFLGVLVGCSHKGLVNEARNLFSVMESVHNVPRELKHYGCMADLLGRAGRIGEAAEMIAAMPMKGDVFVWGGFLSGCRLHGDVAAAELAAERVVSVKPSDGGVYSVMAGLYAAAQRWEDVVRVRRSMEASKETAVINKIAGVSLIRFDGVTYEFVAGDDLHPRSGEIYSVLNSMEKHQSSV